jgi:hypothetical protein
MIIACIFLWLSGATAGAAVACQWVKRRDALMRYAWQEAMDLIEERDARALRSTEKRSTNE